MGADTTEEVDLEAGFDLAPGTRLKFSGTITPGATHLLIASTTEAARVIYEHRRPKVLTTFHLPMHDAMTEHKRTSTYHDIVERMPFANFAVREEFATDFGGRGADGLLINARGVDDLVIFKVPHGTATLFSYASKISLTATTPDRITSVPKYAEFYRPDPTDPKETSLNLIGRLYDYLYNRKHRFIEKHVSKRERKRLDLPPEYAEYVIVGPDDFRYPNAIRPNEIAVRMRELHADPVWVRGHMRTYRHERYINVQGQRSFIQPHVRGEGEEPARARDYYVGGANVEKGPDMIAATTADGKPLFKGQIVADKRTEVLAYFARRPKRTQELEDVEADLAITRPQAEWACWALVSEGSLENVGTYRFRLVAAEDRRGTPVQPVEPEPPAAVEPVAEALTPALDAPRPRKEARKAILDVLGTLYPQPLEVKEIVGLVDVEMSEKLAGYHLGKMALDGLVTRARSERPQTWVLARELPAARPEPVAQPAIAVSVAPEQPAAIQTPGNDFATLLRAQIAAARRAVEDAERRAREAEEQAKSLREKLLHMEALL